MIKHHPDTNMLTEYAAGTLSMPESIAVAAHIEMCPESQLKLKQLNDLGGHLMDSLEPTPVSEDCLDKIMSRLDEAPEPPATTDISRDSGMPKVISKLVEQQKDIKWRSIGTSLRSAQLKTGIDSHAVSLHKIYAGGKVIDHDHRSEEITLVLQGSFSDENGIYHRGDFILKKPGEAHKPQAAKNEDCLCLVVESAPVLLRGLFSRWLNPLLRINAG